MENKAKNFFSYNLHDYVKIQSNPKQNFKDIEHNYDSMLNDSFVFISIISFNI